MRYMISGYFMNRHVPSVLATTNFLENLPIISYLKVDGNEKGGQEGDSNSDSVWHCGDRGLV
jgi:hypothetical protein